MAMEPRIEERDGFRVLGIEDDAQKLDDEDPGFEDIWMNRFMSRHDDVKQYSTDGSYYGLFFNTIGTDLSKARYLAGMAVGPEAVAPEGWVIREIPAAEYAVFETTLRDVGDASEEALSHWLPNSDFEQDTSKPRFDQMPPDTSGPESPTWVWIPIERKA